MQYGRVRRVQLNLPRGEHTAPIEVVDAEGGLLLVHDT